MSDTDERTSWLVRLLPALTFVVGLAIGSLVVLAGTGGDDTGAGTPKENTAASPSASPTGDTVVTVPEACREAGANLSAATALLRDSVDSVRDFQPDRIVKALDRLQTLDQQTRPLVARCSAVRVSQGVSPSATQSPTS